MRILVTKFPVFSLSFFSLFFLTPLNITVAPPIRFPRKFTRNFNSMVFRTFAINNTKIVTWTASIINDSAITLRRTMLSCFPRCSLTCTKRASVCCSVDLFDLFTLYFSSPFFFFFSANLPPLAVSFRCTRTEQTRGQDTSVSFHCPLPPLPSLPRSRTQKNKLCDRTRSNDIIYSSSRPIRGTTVITRLSRKTGRSQIRFSILDCDRFTSWK